MLALSIPTENNHESLSYAYKFVSWQNVLLCIVLFFKRRTNNWLTRRNWIPG